MLTLEVDGSRYSLEHSLLSISKWEQKYEKAFWGKDEKTPEEMADYILMMLIDDYPDDFIEKLQIEDYKAITDHINSRQSATWFRETETNKPSNETITSELIYYWLVQFQIPFHPTETWHFNRLMNLIRIAGIKQTKPKKMSKKEAAEQYRKLNEQRRRELGTSG